MNADHTPEREWPLRCYTKRELAEAYAPNITTGSALNRLARWIKWNKPLYEALCRTGYTPRQQVFTSLQVGLIFEYIGKP